MPSIFTYKGYHIYFWMGDGSEPVHVHVCKGKPSANATKIWVTSGGGCLLAHNKSKIPLRELNQIMLVVSADATRIVELWQSFFGRVAFYC